MLLLVDELRQQLADLKADLLQTHDLQLPKVLTNESENKDFLLVLQADREELVPRGTAVLGPYQVGPEQLHLVRVLVHHLRLLDVLVYICSSDVHLPHNSLLDLSNFGNGVEETGVSSGVQDGVLHFLGQLRVHYANVKPTPVTHPLLRLLNLDLFVVNLLDLFL